MSKHDCVEGLFARSGWRYASGVRIETFSHTTPRIVTDVSGLAVGLHPCRCLD
jgi:hypothetical protein